MRIVLLAGVNAGVMHSLYPLIKRRYRPPTASSGLILELLSLLATLDEHSLELAHAMTLSAVLTPIVMLGQRWRFRRADVGQPRLVAGSPPPIMIRATPFAVHMLGLGLGYPISAGILSFW